MSSPNISLSYRRQQEEFVSQTNGTSVLEVSIVMSILPATIILRDSLYLVAPYLASSSFKSLFDFLIVIVISELSLTIFSEHVVLVLSATVVTIVLLLTPFASDARDVCRNLLQSSNILHKSVFPNHNKRQCLRFITYARACVNIATAICILAVDFRIYPRRFAKTETFGTGVMDAGVGLFVMSNALVAPEARHKTVHYRSLLDKMSQLFVSVKSCVPLLTLGLSRVMVIKGIEYQEHVSEYGTHWNFFFTLAAVKICSTIFFCFFSSIPSLLVSVVVAVGYQWCLQTGLQDYLLHSSDGKGSRVSLLDANREGLFSSFGYVALYFAGIQIGGYIFLNRKSFLHWMKCLQGLTALSIGCWVSLQLCCRIVGPISRRLANLPYVIWIVGLCSMVLAIFLSADLLLSILLSVTQKENNLKKSSRKQKKNPSAKSSEVCAVPSKSKAGVCLLDAINYNGLVFFLTSNLLTGAVNLVVKTLYAPPWQALTILTAYMFTSCMTMNVLRYFNLALRFW